MGMQGKQRREDRPAGAFCAAVMAILSVGLSYAGQTGAVSGPDADRPSDDPYYIVLCTDVSGSMNESDPLYRDRSGKFTTLRDDAQLTFLTLLGECPIESFVGACKFSDRIAGGLPGGEAETVAIENSLLPWRRVGADWESLRERLSTRKSDAGGTRIETALRWGYRRISLAREKSQTAGHGVVILLSDGDPDRASGELRGGAILDMARELAAKDIRVYSVIVNKASYRPGRTTSRLSDRETSAEQLMERVADMTGGGTHRITATSGLLQIFLDIFRIVPTSPPLVNPTTFDVSRYHRTVVFIGPLSSTIRIEPFSPAQGEQAYLLPVADGLDEASGIDRRIIPLTLWNIIILRRPADTERLDRYWCGTWRPALAAADARYGGRVYLITDFLLRLAMEPSGFSWTNERVRVAAHLVERPRELGEQEGQASPLAGGNLSLSFLVKRSPAAAPLQVAAERWEESQQVCRSAAFQVDVPGQYVVACECADSGGNRTIPLGEFSADLSVEPSPISWTLRRVSDGQIVFPREGDATPDAASVKGGEKVYAELRERSGTVAQDLDAQFHVTNAIPTRHSFRVESGRRVTEPFELPKGDIHLSAQAQVRLTEAGMIRELSLPGDFFYDRGDLALDCQFSDSRTALWVGEYHRQILNVSVFPVFAETANAVAGLFPRELAQPAMTFLDPQSGSRVTLPIRCVLGTVTRSRQQNALRLTAAYRLELAEPIPPCGRCEIELGPILTGLEAPKKEYEVVDSARQGIFVYRVGQSGGDPNRIGIAETLVANEPVVFRVERGANQGIGDVLFEFREQGGGEDPNATAALIPLTGTAATSEIDYSLQKELRKDTNYDVYVRANVRPEGSNQDVRLRLYGGSFRSVERYLELQQLVVGSRTGEDLSCHAMETIQVPLRACFSGYRSGNPEHSRVIADFKDSCRLAATSDSNDRSDVSASIQWLKAQVLGSDGSNPSYELEGYALFTPGAMGRHRMEFRGEV
ncbi:MAG: vWA domain-containing protein, partial [Solirubrobacterales bacterium]